MKQFKTLSVFLLLSLLLVACSANGEQPASGSQPPVDDPTSSIPAVTIPTATQAPSSVLPGGTLPTVEVVHEMAPGDPHYLDTQLIWECSLGIAYDTYQTIAANDGCDAWEINYIERPYAEDLQEYFPYLDIEVAQFGSGDGWFYARLIVHEAAVPVDGVGFSYFFELDKSFDGRGDVLVAVTNLPLNAFNWTVTGVRAWQDANGDVGAERAIRADGAASGDGYELILFDQGQGPDPDLVWVRRSPTNPRSIEFAFKPSLLEGDESFLWWGWAARGELVPASFDLVDHSAGLYELDNTCSMEFNGNPMGFPNGCRVIQPTPTPSPSCIQPPYPGPGWIWNPQKCEWELWN